MAITTDIWALEEGFWTGGRAAFVAHMAPGCLMAFPSAGLLQNEAILERIDSGPRWRSVTMSGRRLSESDTTIVLGYVANAERAGTDYRAVCTTVYRRDGQKWLLIQHHQTPL